MLFHFFYVENLHILHHKIIVDYSGIEIFSNIVILGIKSYLFVNKIMVLKRISNVMKFGIKSLLFGNKIVRKVQVVQIFSFPYSMSFICS